MKNIDDLCHIYDENLFNIDDLDILLHEILKITRELLNCEAGSIYINEGDALSFNVFQNDAMSYENIYKQLYALKDLKLPLSEQEKYLAVQCFTTKKIIIIDDVYDAHEYDFLGVKEFDKKFNYRTHSIITVPLVHPIEKKTLGVLQLLNKKEGDKSTTFCEKDKQLLAMISSFISLAIANAQINLEKLEKINKELEDANKQLKKRVKKEIQESQRKSSIIYHQSKLASMGEMIGNIAHQWRQPLSAISTISSGLSFNIEIGNFDEKDSMRGLRQIVQTTQYLSQTIDDFREFYKPDKIEKIFNISSNILSCITITEASLSENHIQVFKDLDEEQTLLGFENEFKQAMLNIIQNAKDALLEKLNIGDERLIFITLKKVDGNIVIKIRDNGLGIDEKIIEKIFEQNFTTKNENGGTGIGLFMSREIIEKHMNGFISVSNVEYTHNDKLYKGAEFTILFHAN